MKILLRIIIIISLLLLLVFAVVAGGIYLFNGQLSSRYAQNYASGMTDSTVKWNNAVYDKLGENINIYQLSVSNPKQNGVAIGTLATIDQLSIKSTLNNDVTNKLLLYNIHQIALNDTVIYYESSQNDINLLHLKQNLAQSLQQRYADFAQRRVAMLYVLATLDQITLHNLTIKMRIGPQNRMYEFNIPDLTFDHVLQSQAVPLPAVCYAIVDLINDVVQQKLQQLAG